MSRRLWLGVVALFVAAGAAIAVLVVHAGGGRAPRPAGSHQAASSALGSGRTATPRAQHSVTGAAPRTEGSCLRARWTPTASRSYAAVVRRFAVVRSQPGSGPILARFSRLDQNGLPNTFAILGARGEGCRPGWYRVQFSALRNGRTGWVASWLVATFRVDTRIVVRLSRRQLVMFRSGKRTLSARVAVGTAQTPTPTGRFFVNERWRLVDPGGPFGVAALGISAHSTVLHDWVQGGPIALHGTNEPDSIGRAASHGCLRVANSIMRRMLRFALLGTPVVIRP